MDSFIVEGGRPLRGEMTPQGAKNEALQILCAVFLTEEPVTVSNVPDILDVINLIQLQRHLGVKVQNLGESSWRFQADKVDLELIKTEQFRSRASAMRGSVMLLGPLLARCGQCAIPEPGGDKIGRRRLDTHLNALKCLGATISHDTATQVFVVSTEDGLRGAYVLLEEASVTGTANVLMAAALAKGDTTIYNAACEPYIQQLSMMINRMGGKISGIGSNLLHIEGVDHLTGTDHRCLPDIIEVGSFIGLAAVTRAEVTIKDCAHVDLGAIPRVFQRLGVHVVRHGNDLHVPAQSHHEIESFMDGGILTISDAPWPGFPSDLLPIILLVATQARGCVLIHQKMFDGRLCYVDTLIDMGARIVLCDPHRAVVNGVDRKLAFRRAPLLTAQDIRAGMVILIAALAAEGTSTIRNVEQIDRGYERIEERLRALGASIVRRSAGFHRCTENVCRRVSPFVIAEDNTHA